MSTKYSLEERVQLAAEKGCNITTEDWQDPEHGTLELERFLDSIDVPREPKDDN